jgi:superfamily II DNA or RNA helicase
MQNEYGALLKVPITNVKDLDGLMKMLCVKNPDYNDAKRRNRYTNAPKEFHFFEIEEATRSLLVPRNIPDEFFFDGSKAISTSEGYAVNKAISAGFKLRDYQAPFIAGVRAELRAGQTDLTFVLQCGDGKTIMGLYTTYLLQRNALIVVPTHQLAKQWLKEMAEHYPEWTAGYYDYSKKTIYDFTVTTYDLMSDERFNTDFFSQFGITIFDEVHRIGADTYSRILSKTNTKYRISLTATFRRKDNTHEVLKHHTGKFLSLIRPRKKALIIPLKTGQTINLKEYRTCDKRSTPLKQCSEYEEVKWKDDTGTIRDVILTEKYKSPDGKWRFKAQELHGPKYTIYEERDKVYKYQGVSMAAIDTAVSEMPDRNLLLFNLIRLCFSQGRQPIVLAKRKEVLYTLCDMLIDSGVPKHLVGVICSKKAKDWQDYVKLTFGVTNYDEYEESVLKNCSIILGIDRLAKEGMDVERADTLVYVHPEKDIEQSIGRILRSKDGKREALGFYLLDDIPPYQNYWLGKDGAKAMFKKLEHRIYKECTLEEFKNDFLT